MPYEHIQLGIEQGVVTLTLNRPAALNVLTRATIREIDHALDAIADDENARVLLITGAGERAFAAGADIREFMTLADASEAAAFARHTHDVFEKLGALPKPSIAAINGFALGGGLELALACDIRLAADSAMLGLPEVTLGLLPGWGGTTRLVRLIGPGAAKLMILSGMRIDAAQAAARGIVEQVYPLADLMTEARTLAAQIASLSPHALARAKASINHAHDVPLEEANNYEARLFGDAVASEDGREGVQAFIEKRKAQWTGR